MQGSYYMISTIITSYNEGAEVKRTIDSVRSNTTDVEIVLVDDASTDGSCDDVGADRLIKHETRIGIAASRNDGVAATNGDTTCYAFLDAHQRVSEGCLNKCADLAIERQAIVWPDVTGLGPETSEGHPESRWMGHGAVMSQKSGRKRGLFDGRWKRRPAFDSISRCSTMIVPGYVIPKTIWPKVRLIEGLKLHGASEPALTVKAFFADVSILHLCGPLARHRFTAGHRLPYECSWRTVVRNHALVARVCFDDSTWREYWYPIFHRWLKDGMSEFDEPHITSQYEDFQKIKQRPDEEFWKGLIQKPRA